MSQGGRLRRLHGSALALLLATAAAQAQTSGAAPAVAAGVADRSAAASPAGTPAAQRSLSDWLARMHEAARGRAFIGTFVVSAGNAMSSARIWHICDGTQQMERVEPLTGPPRSVFRRNDQVVTFLPEQKVARTERREGMAGFPAVLQSADHSLPDFYAVKLEGSERVAGYDADVILLSPKDKLRFPYRIWVEKRTGLVVKLHTLDTDGRVLEQAAFSELQLDAPVRMERLAQMMNATEGWRVERTEAVRTTAEAEGWALRAAVPGFQPVSCYKRPAARSAEARSGAVQWVFSDGLASVSLFIEPFDRQRHGSDSLMSAGATHTLSRRLDQWWLTAVGEVPPATLQQFASGLERRR